MNKYRIREFPVSWHTGDEWKRIRAWLAMGYRRWHFLWTQITLIHNNIHILLYIPLFLSAEASTVTVTSTETNNEPGQHRPESSASAASSTVLYIYIYIQGLVFYTKRQNETK